MQGMPAREAASEDTIYDAASLTKVIATTTAVMQLVERGRLELDAPRAVGDRQAGRYVQRLLEIETYRMMALLAFPLAREVGATLTAAESRLARITERMIDVAPAEEPQLLDDLTRLAAEVERSESASRYRFGAAAAYYRLVRQRIGALREVRLPRVQMIEEFMDRRLAPAGLLPLVAAD